MPVTVDGRTILFNGVYLARENQDIAIDETVQGSVVRATLRFLPGDAPGGVNQIRWRVEGTRLIIEIVGPAPPIPSSIEAMQIGMVGTQGLFVAIVLQRAGNANLLNFYLLTGPSATAPATEQPPPAANA